MSKNVGHPFCGGVRSRPPKDCVNAVVAWLAAEVERIGYVEHETAARAIWRRALQDPASWWGLVYRESYREREVRTNRFGHTYRAKARIRFHPEVLRVFKRRTAKTVVCEKGDRAWRKRKS